MRMARIIDGDKAAPMSPEEGRRNAGGRKLSFKTRGGRTSNSRTCRATKVSLPANSVQEIASKFNAIIVEDESKGRAILKKLHAYKPSGQSVREAVHMFEKASDKPKMVLVRKNSHSKPAKLNVVKEETDIVKDAKPQVKPKPEIDKCHLVTRQPAKIKTQELVKNNKRLSIPKNDILYSVFKETESEVKPNSSFLWGAKDNKGQEAKDEVTSKLSPVSEFSEEKEAKTLEKEVQLPAPEVIGCDEKSETENSEKAKNNVNLGYGKITPEPKANVSSLYRRLAKEATIQQENHSYVHLQASTESTYEVISTKSYEEVENCYDVIHYAAPEVDAIYDDVLNVNESGQNGQCEGIYESIYDAGRSESDSSYEQSNSLYEVRPSSRASSGSGAVVSGASRSDTSDDWVDIEVDEQKEEILVLQDTSKPKFQGGSWSQKVRKQWNSQMIQNQSDVESNGIHYEAVESLYDALCDDFSSDTDSESGYLAQSQPQNGVITKTPPPPPSNEGIYNFMRTAKRKMRKTSLSFGQRLRRISRISMAVPAPSAAEQITHSASTDNISRGKWPSFKKKNSLQSNSTFYLETIAAMPDDKKENPSKENVSPKAIVEKRRMSAAIRPTSPPPPPPPSNTNGDTKLKLINDTSLYMECGLFENSIIPMSDRGKPSSNQSWYSDVGLYENSSTASSDLDLRFANEPLYQFYAASVAERERIDVNSEVNYEEIKNNENNLKSDQNRPSALDLVNSEMHRTLWSQVSQVINSGILDTLSPEKRRLQEAKFELITSEASYYKSLVILEKHFAASPALKDETIVPKADYKTLFGNINPVRKCSEAVLAALEKCWQESILLEGVCDIVSQLAQEKFSSYITYCRHQIAIERTLKTLKKSNSFLEALNSLESSPKCHSLSLYSFLLLPMQRITRMPLLLDAILTKLVPSDPEYDSCKMALTKLSKIVHNCNEAAKQTERLEEMVLLSHSLNFPPKMRRLPLLSESRWLVRSGQVTQINAEPKLTLSKKLTTGRSTSKRTLFLFTDYLILAKKKGDDSYMVVTYCPRKFVQMTSFEDPIIGSNKYLIMVTLLENHEGKTEEMIMSCGSESSRERWLLAFTTPKSKDPNEVLYESWDCPQVSAIHPYTSSQPDELTLQPGDVINVHRKIDGWFYGERTRDREEGWFPGNHTVEIASSHIRARNLKQRHRLLAFSTTFILNKQNNTN
ncbi:uncharacterized protein LOC106662418 [Cimex lectularius]|uniref:Ephexin-1 n=1 Tax=Cimex lectularius TaxID=79782 RepID=A0A8I6RB79_CIMLE|nr:uncharacterized protein LOC106662418 [Cimex lectularius]